jgi:hypothetical protein
MEKSKALRFGGAFVLAVLVATWAPIGFTQSDPHSGTWTLSVDKSKYTPGPAPKSQTTVYTVTAQAVKMTSTQVTAAGATQTTEFSANFDGKDYPVTGTPDYDTTSAKRVNANTIEFTRKKAGKVVQTATSVVAADGKSRNVTVTGVNQAGQKLNNASVYVKK